MSCHPLSVNTRVLLLCWCSPCLVKAKRQNYLDIYVPGALLYLVAASVVITEFPETKRHRPNLFQHTFGDNHKPLEQCVY